LLGEWTNQQTILLKTATLLPIHLAQFASSFIALMAYTKLSLPMAIKSLDFSSVKTLFEMTKG